MDTDRANSLLLNWSIGRELRGVFQSRYWWLLLLTWFYGVLFFIVAVTMAVLFFRTESLAEKIAYATVFLWSVNFIVLVKLWFWMTGTRVILMETFKQLELRIAELAARMERKTE